MAASRGRDRRSSGRAANRNEDKALAASSDLSGRLYGHCDELPGFDGHLLAVNDHSAAAADDGVDIFGPILEMVMEHGLSLGRQLDLVHLEGTDAERFSDSLVEWARSGVRTPACRQGGGIDDPKGHVTQARSVCR